RVQQRPHGPEHRGRVLHLELLADQVREDLAVGGEDAEAFADPEVRRLGGALDGLRGCGHGRWGGGGFGCTTCVAGRRGESSNGPRADRENATESPWRACGA